MPIRDFGAVCDPSVLKDRGSLNKAQSLFNGSGLYIPSSTYSWLSRSKLIQIRHHTVKYSLLKQMVRDRRIYPAHMPELYDEMSRKIMFEADHNIALTDLRSLFLASHLQLPTLTFDENLIERISKEMGIRTLERFEAHANWLTIRSALELYRELSFDSSKRFHERLEDGGNFSETVREVEESHKENFRSTEKSAQKIGQGQTNPGALEFQYLAWNILPGIQEYYEQDIVRPDTLRQICERSILLIASPPKPQNSDQAR